MYEIPEKLLILCNERVEVLVLLLEQLLPYIAEEGLRKLDIYLDEIKKINCKKTNLDV